MAQKGPGKAYRETISLVDILRRFSDNTTAEAWCAEQRGATVEVARTAGPSASRAARPTRLRHTAAARRNAASG